MNTAVYSPSLNGEASVTSKFFLMAKRVVNALVESRARSAAQTLRQHRAFIQDIGRRQDHSSDFLIQDNALPFKI